LCRFRLVGKKIGDGVDGLGGEAFRLIQAASTAADLQFNYVKGQPEAADTRSTDEDNATFVSR
jgi:hypothetical protein